MTDQPKSYKYDVFISYSRKNEEFAGQLEQALESYKPEKDLKVPQRFIEAFRDKEDFTGGNYHKSLLKNLADSSKLIVICSPDARKSQFVNDEIKEFIDIRGTDHIIPVLFSGVPNNEAKTGQEDEMSFPEELCKAIEMPLAVNYLGFDTKKDKINKGIFISSWYSILADTYDLSRSEMEQREKKRRVRQRKRITAISSGILLILSVSLIIAVFSMIRATAAQNKTQNALASEMIQKDKAENAQKDAEVQRDDAIKARNEAKAALDRETVAKEDETKAKDLAETKRQEAEAAAESERVAKDQAEERRKQAEEAIKNEIIAKNQAEERRKEAEAEKDKANAALRTALTENGRDELIGNYPFRAAVYLNRASQIELKNENYTELSTIKFLFGQAMRKVEALRFSVDKVDNASFSRDGKEIFTFGENGLRVWDTETGKETKSSLNQDEAGLLKDNTREDSLFAFSPDYKFLATRIGEYVQLSATGEPRQFIRNIFCKSKVTAIGFSGNGKIMALGFKTGDVNIYSNETGEQISNSIKIDETSVTALSLSPNGELLAAGGYRRVVKILNSESGKEVSSFQIEGILNSISFSPEGENLLVGSDDFLGKVVRLRDMSIVLTFENQSNIILAHFSPDSKRIFTLGIDQNLKVWDLQQEQKFYTDDYNSPLWTGEISRDGKLIAAAGVKGIVHIWSTESGKQLFSFEHGRPITSVQFSPDAKQLITIGEYRVDDIPYRNSKLWSLTAKNEIKSPEFVSIDLKSVGFSDNGKYIFTVDDSRKLKKWSIGGGDQLNLVENISRELMANSGVFSTDGKYFVTNDADKTAYKWDGIDEVEPQLRFKHLRKVNSISYSHEGKSIVTASEDTTVKIWDANTGRNPRTFVHKGIVQTASFSPDDTKIVSVSFDGTIKIWDVKTEKEISAFQGNFNSANFSSDGNSLVTTENNGTVRMWNIASEARSPKEVDSIIKQKIPFSLINDVLIPNDLNSLETNK